MASSNISLILSLLLVVSICVIDVTNGAASSSSQNSPTPSNSVDCSTLVITMADCLSFVTNGSTLTKPEGQCCSSLKSILKDAPTCLCEAFKSSSQLGVVLNVTKALSLPDACKLSAPSLSKCGLSEAPVSAPGGSLTPKTSPTSVVAPVTPAVNEPSVAPSPSKAASALLPISAGSLLVCILSVISGL